MQLIVLETIRFLEGQKFGFEGFPGDTAAIGETMFGTDMYHDAKCHADQCHRRRDICNRADKLSKNHF